ncbi:hypothetical protein HHI36_005287 [Cryptolaemus montrouzieri]|uniref:Uncharacterized protein n=1 Tax=Cryptolaemus montrouzieri TaxID=559131 RepID=A0ABD2NU26_9CUCU
MLQFVFVNSLLIKEEVMRKLLNNALLAILASSLYENTVLPVHRHSRIEFCKKQTLDLMPDITNYLYKKLTLTEELTDQTEVVETMFNQLKKKFDESSQNLEEIDDESSAKKKINGIKLAMFRNNDTSTEIGLLNTSYAVLELDHNDYLYNFFNLMEFRRKIYFSLQGVEVTAENMFRHFVDVRGEEPVTFHSSDIVCIPYGLIKKVTKELPPYVTLAQVGFPLAKIIGHAINSIRIQNQRNDFTNSSDIKQEMVFSNPIYFGEFELSSFTV